MNDHILISVKHDVTNSFEIQASKDAHMRTVL